MPCSSKQSAGFFLVLKNELAHLIDGADAVQVALALRVAPSEQAMAAQKHSVASRVVLHDLLELQGQLKAGPLPRKPLYFASELPIEFLELLFSVRACRYRDRPIRVKVVHVVKRKKRMQRSINGGGDFVCAKSGQR